MAEPPHKDLFYSSTFCIGFYSSKVVGYSYAKHETKKQRIARIAKMKMKASWSLKNERRLMSVYQVIRVCKPQHRIKHLIK